jgi:TatA/E family protein of Tat protein translocase
MFGSIGMPELILIFVVALLVFGPRKLPEIGKSLGKGLAEFKRASEELKKTIEQEISEGKSEVSAARQEIVSAANTVAQIPASVPPPAPAEPAPAEPAAPEARPIHPA